ncbi:hypothetical protein BJF85_10695 [Saccharomonospora sp. CUA-673]|nr:hypothetical protein BJF85_10695 [Saccharomonospora sp. CUA-673]
MSPTRPVRSRTVRLAALTLVAGLTLAGCSDDGGPVSGDSLQVVQDPERAEPAESPATDVEPAGEVVPADGNVTALAASGGTLAVAVEGENAVQLHDLAEPGDPRTVSLPGEVASLRTIDDRIVAAMPDADAFARIDPDSGEARTVEVDGGPAAVAERGDETLVALRDDQTVQVLDAQDRPTRAIGGELYSADDVLVADGGAVVLDKLRTAAFSLDLDDDAIGEGLRAGQGAAMADTDEFGRVLVTDARNGALLAFDAEPLLLRQHHPVEGGAYGVAYDAERDVAWVTLTERNEVVGYSMRGGQPEEKFRLPTVRQPNSVTVDDRTSQVVVGSAAEEGIQVIEP